MPSVQIPDELLAEIRGKLSPNLTVEEFVVQAVREKLALDDQKREFYRVSERNRLAMAERGLSEADILRDFESTRTQRDI